jgi:phage shock protein A
MAVQKTLNKNFKVVDGNVVINETVEKVLSADELKNEKSAYQQRQNQIFQQVEMLQRQYDEMQTAIDELDNMISQLPLREKPTLTLK